MINYIFLFVGLDLFWIFVKKDYVGWSRIVRRWIGLDSSSDIFSSWQNVANPRTYFMGSNGHVERFSGHCMTCGLCEV